MRGWGGERNGGSRAPQSEGWRSDAIVALHRRLVTSTAAAPPSTHPFIPPPPFSDCTPLEYLTQCKERPFSPLEFKPPTEKNKKRPKERERSHNGCSSRVASRAPFGGGHPQGEAVICKLANGGEWGGCGGRRRAEGVGGGTARAQALSAGARVFGSADARGRPHSPSSCQIWVHTNVSVQWEAVVGGMERVGRREGRGKPGQNRARARRQRRLRVFRQPHSQPLLPPSPQPSTRRLSPTGIKTPASVHLKPTTRPASAPSATSAPASAFLPLTLSAATARAASPLTDYCCRFLESSASVADGARVRVASARAAVVATVLLLSVAAATASSSASSSVTALAHHLAVSSAFVAAFFVQRVRVCCVSGAAVAAARAGRRAEAEKATVSCSYLAGVSSMFE